MTTLSEPRRTILIVDADSVFRSFLSGLLRPRSGLEVLQARGAWDVWPWLETHDVALFVIDAEVPDTGGLALVEELRRRRVAAPVLFVASDWQDHEAHGRLTNKLGVQRVMHKPFSAYQFIMEVESTLEAPKATLQTSEPPPAQGSVPRRLVSEPAMAAVDYAAPSSISRGTTTFVVIGVDEALTSALEQAAEAAVVSLVSSPDAAGATKLLEQRRIDGALVLLDVDDPDAAFAEATELLCSEAGRSFPIGFVSNETDVHTRMNAIHAGGVVHLTPPFDARDLRHAATAMGHARRDEPPLCMVVADPVRGAELSALLRRARMKVDAVTDAYTLLGHLEVATPDLLLFDIDLPGVSGLDVCKLLRASPSWRALALMLVSTHGSSEARIAAFDAGADDFLVKPLGEEELLARVEARVRRHRAVRESADKDPTTGLLQRHAFVDRARALLAAARRSAAVAAFCIVRVDNLSRIRADHDQLTCERAVSSAGRHIAPLLREYDLRARWSEDELILALPDVDATMAEHLFARLATVLSRIEMMDDDNRPLPLSFRAGAAAHPDDAHSIPALVGMARRRLAPLPRS